MARWIVRFPNRAGPPPDDLDVLEQNPSIRLIDRVGARLAMVDASPDDLPRLRAVLPGWRIEREQHSRLPDTWPITPRP